MPPFRDLLFGDWRNKGVALFFAITIWVVAFHSEKQEYTRTLPLTVEPAVSSGKRSVITGVHMVEGQGGVYPEFGGRLRLVFSGTRRQIEKIRDELPQELSLRVPAELGVHSFQQSDFNFPRDGVEITRFIPDAIRVLQDEEVAMTVDGLSGKLNIVNLREGHEVASKEVQPDSVDVFCPKSIMDKIGVAIGVSMEFTRDRLEAVVAVSVTHRDEVAADLVRRTVRVRPKELRISVATRASMDVLSVDSVKVTFRLPAMLSPIKINLDDIVGDTIPVEFHGRKDEIARLRDRLRDQPGFSVGVRVPAFDRENGGQFTFTEDSLELYGFTSVQIRQHESRRREKKTAWSYSIVPVREPEKQ